MHRSLRVPLTVAGLGVVAVVAGIVVFFTHRDSTLAVGYSSYAPLDTETTFAPGGVLWSAGAVAGLAVIAVGFVVLAAVAGYLLGRRRSG